MNDHAGPCALTSVARRSAVRRTPRAKRRNAINGFAN